MNYDQYSFKKAFSLAHDAGEDTFRWQGKLYTTKRADKSETKARKSAKAASLAQSVPSLKTAENFEPAPPVDPMQNLLGALSSGHHNVMGMLRPAVEGAQQMAYGDAPPDLLGMLTSGHQNIVGKLAAANQDYTTWNKLRNMLGQPAVPSLFYQGQPNMVDLTSPVLRDPRRMSQGKIR